MSTRGLVLFFGVGASPSGMGFENEAESFGRPCHQTVQADMRSRSSMIPRGISFHDAVEGVFPPIGFGFALSCCGSLLPGPTEFGSVGPDAVHDHGQPARQCHDRLFHPAAPDCIAQALSHDHRGCRGAFHFSLFYRPIIFPGAKAGTGASRKPSNCLADTRRIARSCALPI